MIHHAKREAVLDDWRAGYRVDGIAKARGLTVEETVAVLVIEGVPFSRLSGREGKRRRLRCPALRKHEIATLMARGVK